MISFFWGESSQKCLIVTVLIVNKVKFPISLKCHKRPVGFRWSNIGKLNSLWHICCQPGHHLHLEAVWTGLPPEFVNIRANKPVKSSGCRSTDEYYRWCYSTLQDDIHIGGCHEGYDRTERYREAACRERQKFYFFYGRWDWTMINNSSFLVIFFPRLSSATWSNANLVVILCSCGLRCPSFWGSRKLGWSFESRISTDAPSTCHGPKTMVCWTMETNIYK